MCSWDSQREVKLESKPDRHGAYTEVGAEQTRLHDRI